MLEKLLKGFLSDYAIQRQYVLAGSAFGLEVRNIHQGECEGFEKLLNDWAFWETEYAQRGYRTISVDDFTLLGAYLIDISNLIGVKRKSSEGAVYHAEIYRKLFLGQIPPKSDTVSIMGLNAGIMHGAYALPSTKEFEIHT